MRIKENGNRNKDKGTVIMRARMRTKKRKQITKRKLRAKMKS
jgi:hypothetical protein